MYSDSIWVTLFFYIIASLNEAFCVVFYKSRNAYGVKLGQIFSKECIHSRLHLSISLEVFSSQVAFECRNCLKVTWRVWWMWKNYHPKRLSPCVPHLASEVRPVKNSLLHLRTIKSSGNWLAAYVLQKRQTLSAAETPSHTYKLHHRVQLYNSVHCIQMLHLHTVRIHVVLKLTSWNLYSIYRNSNIFIPHSFITQRGSVANLHHIGYHFWNALRTIWMVLAHSLTIPNQLLAAFYSLMWTQHEGDYHVKLLISWWGDDQVY